jgi:hypothetical protein
MKTEDKTGHVTNKKNSPNAHKNNGQVVFHRPADDITHVALDCGINGAIGYAI